MASTFTTLLRLNKPALGDAGWGTAVNGGFTDLADSAIAGTTTLNTDADVTLTTANGVTDQARQMILNCTGSRAAQRTITAPAESKVYVIINGTTGGFGVKIVGVGPTTGVVVPNGRMAVVAWNGTDFVTLGAVVDLTATGNVSFDGGTFVFNESGADKDARFEGDGDPNLLFLDASTDQVGIGTSSPAHKLDVFASGVTHVARFRRNDTAAEILFGGDATNSILEVGNRPLQYRFNGSAQMTFDISGNLGIGTSSPGYKLDVHGASGVGIQIYETSTGNNNRLQIIQSGVDSTYNNTFSTGSGAHAWQIGNTERMRLDNSGNLGLGVTPSASTLPTFESEYGIISGKDEVNILQSAYYASGNFLYSKTEAASRYLINSGSHTWYTAASGNAGDPISFTQVMTLDASGKLFVGTTSGASALNLFGSGVNWFTISSSTANGSYGSFIKGGASTAVGYIGTDGGGIIGGGSGDNFGIRAESDLLLMAGTAERARITSAGDFIHQVNGTAPTLSTNSTMSFELTSNTSLKVVVRGTDGVTRSVSLTLS